MLPRLRRPIRWLRKNKAVKSTIAIAEYVGIIKDQLVNIWKGGTTLSPFSPIAKGDTIRELASKPAHVPSEIPIMKIKRFSNGNVSSKGFIQELIDILDTE